MKATTRNNQGACAIECGICHLPPQRGAHLLHHRGYQRGTAGIAHHRTSSDGNHHLHDCLENMHGPPAPVSAATENHQEGLPIAIIAGYEGQSRELRASNTEPGLLSRDHLHLAQHAHQLAVGGPLSGDAAGDISGKGAPKVSEQGEAAAPMPEDRPS
ncbi:uncharacterized protein LOC114590187 isoform X1 [Podarcis muralis]